MIDGMLAFVAQEACKGFRAPSKKAFQKLVYFMQACGVPFGLRYGMHLYGPYSESLASMVESKVWEGTLAYSPEGQSVIVKPGPASEIVIQEEENDIQQYSGTIMRVLRHFGAKSPSELELLSTTHYLAQQLGADDDRVIEKVEEIKGTKFTTEDIREALVTLRRLQYV